MKPCGQSATLVITQQVVGTSTSVARRRVALKCSLPEGHAGAHHDERHDESWAPTSDRRPTILRHEDEEN